MDHRLDSSLIFDSIGETFVPIRQSFIIFSYKRLFQARYWATENVSSLPSLSINDCLGTIKRCSLLFQSWDNRVFQRIIRHLIVHPEAKTLSSRSSSKRRGEDRWNNQLGVFPTYLKMKMTLAKLTVTVTILLTKAGLVSAASFVACIVTESKTLLTTLSPQRVSQSHTFQFNDTKLPLLCRSRGGPCVCGNLK